MSRRLLIFVVAVLVTLSNAAPVPDARPRNTVTVGVLGLFHPRELVVGVAGPEALVVTVGDRQVILQRTSRLTSARIEREDDEVVVSAGGDVFKAKEVVVTGRANEAADFNLSVPRRIQRHYRGTLRVHCNAADLVPVVAMDLELAVASVVAAESTVDTPTEARKALAVSVRSYFVAGGRRHAQFDFCDTTHCQFLREPPAPGSAAMKAVEATQGLVLTYQSRPFAAMYTLSCSGQTHTPSLPKLPGGLYPYFAVECAYCRAHPDRWSSRISEADSRQLRSRNENSRLAAVRRLGWQAVPSNDFTRKKVGDSVLLEGIGHGHGIGLCQRGSRAMARAGHDFRDILLHYYPNTVLQHVSVGGDD